MAAGATWPRIEHTRVTTAKPGEPLRIAAQVFSPDVVASVKLRYRHVTQFEDYATLELTRTDDQPASSAFARDSTPPPTAPPAGDLAARPAAPAVAEFSGIVPGEFLTPEWDFMYFIEATDRAGHGVQWPDLTKEAPYVIVPLDRKAAGKRKSPAPPLTN